MKEQITEGQNFLMITPSEEGMSLEDFANQFKGKNVTLHYKDSEGIYHEWTQKKTSNYDIEAYASYTLFLDGEKWQQFVDGAKWMRDK